MPAPHPSLKKSRYQTCNIYKDDSIIIQKRRKAKQHRHCALKHRPGSTFNQNQYFSAAVLFLISSNSIRSAAYLFSCVASPISGPYFYYLCFSRGDSFAGKTKWMQSVIIKRGARFFPHQGRREMCLCDTGILSRMLLGFFQLSTK